MSALKTGNENTFVGRMALRFDLKIDKDWSEREAELCIYKKIFEGKLYDNLGSWHQEYQDGGGQYIPLAKRRPCVIYRVPKIIVDESTSMLFGESHFPVARGQDQSQTDFLASLVATCDLKSRMLEAAKAGALGSVCLWVKILKGKIFVDVLETLHLTPVFDREDPDSLVEITEKRKVSGATLLAAGYDIPTPDENKNKQFYVKRTWTPMEEIIFKPYPCEKDQDKQFKPSKDEELSTLHGLGFVPLLWIKNTHKSTKIDGDCTFEGCIDTCIEMDYQLSQLGRMLKYNSDPTIVVKDPGNLTETQIIKGQPITLGENGDAWMLEMSNSATAAVIDYVRCLREFSLEVLRGNRANPDKMSAIHSGKALQMLNSKLITLVEDLRTAYGENGLKRLFMLIVKIIDSGKFDVKLNSKLPKFSENMLEDITLEWPEWYPPTPQDDLQEAQSLQTYVGMGVISKEGALKVVADKLNVIDVKKELTQATNDAKDMQDANNQQKTTNQASKKPKKAVARQTKSVVRSKDR